MNRKLTSGLCGLALVGARTDGGFMAGGHWVVYSNDNVIQANTYGSCTAP